MKILLGTHENCGIISRLQNGFKSLGHDIKTIVKHRDKYFVNEIYDFDITQKNFLDNIFQRIPVNALRSKFESYKQKKKYQSIFNGLLDFDLYVYTWDTILPDLRDLVELKKRNKKIFFLFIGSDVRFAAAFTQQFPDVNIPWNDYYLNEDINKKLLYIRTVEKYTDAIFSVPDQAGLEVCPFYHMHLPLEVDTIPFYYPDNKIPVIVHVPSNRALKGTSLIEKAIEECRAKGLDFEFKIIEHQSNSVIKEELARADIVIDQVYLHGPGMLGIEAMASGCALATKFFRLYESFQPPVCYIDHTSLITSNLTNLISDRDFRRQLAYEGRRFVEMNNSPKIIAAKMVAINEEKVNQKDYNPEFFINQFRLFDDQKLNENILKLNRELIDKYSPKFDVQSLSARRLI